ncbi:hypothetical protein HGRIS_009030 [Hohenbuehelia grisea]|uniref:Cytosolic endo-beta-N-acetylglucosaminidase TIM barrel domain-containing protein n=1 Tax=Hohenbuehelia grisea TaxID=104357 RepID=A0ABR3J030_9AGAR
MALIHLKQCCIEDMPLLGTTWEEKADGVCYFQSLAELDDRSSTTAPNLDSIIPYYPRPSSIKAHRGKLLVCHDYKGGYTENPFSLSYTYNFWSRSDVFIYFAHHRISLPPPGWINAAHRQGNKILGTIIFEGNGEPDCLRLLVGRLPVSKTGPAKAQTQVSTSLPISPHYARLLADLAYQHGFDGYLLNFECPLRGGVEQTQALTGWISLLQNELNRKVGSHSEVIWYDSVVITGQLAWQDRLNAANLPFFLPSSGFFTNYTWRRDYPAQTAQYFTSIDPSLTTDAVSSGKSRSKNLQDIYVGVDVWGRGCHGGGGLGCYRAIEHISPESLGLSVALFGQAWTWETEQDKPGFTWETWWDYERKLWVGPLSGEVEVPEAPRRKGEPECVHGSFVALSKFFEPLSPPDPAALAFHTTYSPGVGRKWFVDGVQVLEREGWTDVDKQTSLGDMVWPRPLLSWEGDERKEEVPHAVPEICMDDAWNGGSSLRLSISCLGSDAEDAFFRQVWIPVQSLVVTPRRTYQFTAIYKLEHHAEVDIDVGLAMRSADGLAVDVVADAISPVELASGWIKLSGQVTLAAREQTAPSAPAGVTLGLTVSIATEDPSVETKCSILVGQMNVALAPPRAFLRRPQILWADFEHTAQSESGTVRWQVATSLPVQQVTLGSVDDPTPAWSVESAEANLPGFLYSNIYVQAHDAQGAFVGPEKAIWIGTSGMDGLGQGFKVYRQNLPLTEGEIAKGVRFYVQGVTEHGDVLPWDQCAFVDAEL